MLSSILEEFHLKILMNIELPPVNTCFLAADGDTQKLYAYLRAKMLQFYMHMQSH